MCKVSHGDALTIGKIIIDIEKDAFAIFRRRINSSNVSNNTAAVMTTARSAGIPVRTVWSEIARKAVSDILAVVRHVRFSCTVGHGEGQSTLFLNEDALAAWSGDRQAVGVEDSVGVGSTFCPCSIFIRAVSLWPAANPELTIAGLNKLDVVLLSWREHLEIERAGAFLWLREGKTIAPEEWIVSSWRSDW